MDKISNQEIFSAIRASTILAPYLEQNSELAELINTSKSSQYSLLSKPCSGKTNHAHL